VKNEKNRHPRGTSSGRDVVRDWKPLLARLQDAIDWALDIARTLAREYDEEIEAIERTRDYVHAWIHDQPVEVDMNDVLTVLAILFAAIEIDIGVDSSPMLEPLRRFPAVVHLPGATPTVVVRRPPRRRNGGALFTQLAA
jgi:hypothetical protein